MALAGIDGIDLSGLAEFEFNDTGFVIDHTLSMPGGGAFDIDFDTPAVTSDFTLPDMSLGFLDFDLSGALNFDKVDIGGIDGFMLDLSGIDLSLGDGPSGIDISEALGQLLLSPAGLAGELSGPISIGSPGAEFGGNYTVAINTMKCPRQLQRFARRCSVRR